MAEEDNAGVYTDRAMEHTTSAAESVNNRSFCGFIEVWAMNVVCEEERRCEDTVEEATHKNVWGNLNAMRLETSLSNHPFKLREVLHKAF